MGSEIYGEEHERLQNEYDTKDLAAQLENLIVKDFIDETDREFINSRDMFFLSSIDKNGCPTVSFKGGQVGFVEVLNEKQIAFPIFDGNGMFLSAGNIEGNNKVGLLFIDFETPHRLRMQGEAFIDRSVDLVNRYPAADLIIKVNLTRLWVNCPRYIPKYKKIEESKYIPKKGQPTLSPAWKRIKEVKNFLPKKDQEILQGEETITFADYARLVSKGKA